MNLLGLDKDLYLINNPIVVTLFNFTQYTTSILLTLRNVNNSSSPIIAKDIILYTNGNEMKIDISEYIKGNFTEPNLENKNLALGQDIDANYVYFRIGFKELQSDDKPVLSPLGDFEVRYKTFIRGGAETIGLNASQNTLSVGDVLKESEKIPTWGSYPVRKYVIKSNKKIGAYLVGPSDITDKKRSYGCDPLYVMFANTKGGYSYWLFDSHELRLKTKSEKNIERNHEDKDLHLGLTTSYTMNAETRVKRPYYQTIKALIKSHEVYFYNKFNTEWAYVRMGNNTFNENNYEDIQDISLKFDVRLRENTSVIW